jgi:hypothetical protein
MGTGPIIDDRYRLDGQIATGGVGQVWRATDLLLERPVAVKVLRPEYADHPDTIERFRKEARLAGALSHPRVAQVYDFGHGGPDRSPYLVMEYVDGPSLADLLLASPLAPVAALDVIAQAADGLSAAHRAGLVHRDVKPGNILIGQEGRVKVSDFGIAHAVGQAPVTDPALVMGTSQYLAPERITGGSGSPVSDLYSLGIVLYECLTGIPPYDGTAGEVMAGHLYLPLPPLPATVPPELDALVAQLTVKDPARRLGDARELAALASRLRDAIALGPARVPTPAGPAGAATVVNAGRGAAPAVADEERAAPSYPTVPPDILAPDDFDAAGGFSLGTENGPDPGRAGTARDPLATRRRKRAAALTAGIVLLAGGGLIGLLASGALRAAPAANRTPAGPTSGAAPQRTRPATPSSSRPPAPGGAVASPAPATSGSPTGHAKHGKHGKGGKKGKATPSPTGSSTGSAGPTPGPSSPGAPTTTPSGTPTGTPTGSPSTSPSAVPSPSPTPSVCVLGICL